MTSVSVWLREDESLRLELAAQRRVVLDHAVVDDGDAEPPRRGRRGAGWALRSVAGPCVAQRVWLIPQPPGAGSRSSSSSSARTRPGPLAHDQPVAVERREPRAVVAAIFEPPQARRPGSAPPRALRCIRRFRTSAPSSSISRPACIERPLAV